MRETASCAHCGLSVRRRTVRRGSGPGTSSPDDVYCCIGCRIAARIAPGDRSGGRFLEARMLFAAFLAMGVMTFSLVLWGEHAYIVEPDPSMDQLRALLRVVLALFSFPVFVLLGPDFARGAWLDLRQGVFRMDALILLATLAAYALSVVNTLQGTGEVYYETATMVLVIVSFGRRLEAHTRVRTRDAVELLKRHLPAVAHRLTGATEEEVAPDALEVGELVRIAPGEQFPADVRVLAGESQVSLAHVTGEEAALRVAPGDGVVAGSINGDGQLRVVVERKWVDGGLGRIRELLNTPLPATRTTRTVDRLAGWLTVLAVSLAVGAGVYHGVVRDSGLGDGLRVGLAVLLVACPCALGLATPLAYRAVRAGLAERGVLVRDPAGLEAAARLDTIVFDKTGTLTEGGGMVGARGDRVDELTRLIRASNHALGRGLSEGVLQADSLELVPGKGVRAHRDGVELRAGKPEWVEGITTPGEPDALAAHARELKEAGHAVVAMSEDGVVRAIAGVEQRLRPGAVATVERLKELGLAVEILSGDQESAVRQVADELGVVGRAGVEPEGKVARLAELRGAGHHVALVGDGVNDAPALRQADVAIAIDSGTALARSQAQVEFLGANLSGLPLLVEAARRLRTAVRGNLAWTLAYNGVALGFAATHHLHPLVAVVLMVASSVVVSVRSFRLMEDPS